MVDNAPILDGMMKLFLEDSRQKIGMLMLNGRIWTISQLRREISDGQVPRKWGRSYSNFKHHVKLLCNAKLVEQVDFGDKSKLKGYKLSSTGRFFLEYVMGIKKKETQKLEIEVKQEGG